MIPGGEVSAHQTEPLRAHGAQRGQVVAPQEGVHLQRTDTPESGFTDPSAHVLDRFPRNVLTLD